MLALKRILLSILVSVSALTTFVASPASADSYSYNCDQNAKYAWNGYYNYGNWWGHPETAYQSVPFSLRDGTLVGYEVGFNSNGDLWGNNLSIHAADTRTVRASVGGPYGFQQQQRYGYFTWGATSNTLCVSWNWELDDWGVSNTWHSTTLRMFRSSSGKIFGSVENYFDHEDSGSYPSVNGQRFDSSFVISDGRFYPYAAVPASVDSGSATGNSVTLGYTLQSDNQDNPVTDYALQYRKAGGSWRNFAHVPATDGSATVSGLDYVSDYEFRIASVTDSGLGPWSDAYAVSTTSRPASAPTITDFITSKRSVEVKIQDPAIIGDVALTDYEYSSDDGSSWKSFKTATGPFVISGLQNATTYPIRVRAVNTAGAGEASEAISAMPTRFVPAAPSVSLVSVGDQMATLSIDVPSDDTAKSVTGYQYNVNKGLSWKPCVVIDHTCTIGSLINGTSSKLKIRAVNSNGFSIGSTIVEAISRTTPQAPKIISVTPSIRSLRIDYRAPADNGGSLPTGYEYSIDGGNTWTLSTAKLVGPIFVYGLTNATVYDVSVRAINAAGTGLPSTIVQGKTPAVIANEPTVDSLNVNQSTLTFDFTPPTDNGGAEITSYSYTLDGGKTWSLAQGATATNRVTVTNLIRGRTFVLRLRGINSAGKGAASIIQVVRTLK